MRTLSKIFLLGIIAFVSALTNIALAQSYGTIHFSGRIVEQPCNIFSTESALIGQCTRNAQVKSVTINARNIHYTREVNLPHNFGKMHIQPIAHYPAAAIVTVIYL